MGIKKYDEIGVFTGGIAPVKKDGKWSYSTEIRKNPSGKTQSFLKGNFVFSCAAAQ